MPQEQLHIMVEFSDASLFDSSEGLEYVDQAASARQYGEMVSAALREKYPGAEVRTSCDINDQVTINGDTDHSEIPWIRQAIGDIYEGWEWVSEDFPTD